MNKTISLEAFAMQEAMDMYLHIDPDLNLDNTDVLSYLSDDRKHPDVDKQENYEDWDWYSLYLQIIDTFTRFKQALRKYELKLKDNLIEDPIQ